jgi:hypothetical protein
MEALYGLLILKSEQPDDLATVFCDRRINPHRNAPPATLRGRDGRS